MANTSLSEEMKERPWSPSRKPVRVGPFITISRQYGCQGYSLGLLLVRILADKTGRDWNVYHKEILSRLATETKTAQEMLEREMAARPSMVTEFFRAFSQEHIPSGFEIRNRITTIIRGLAIGGHAIIIGQGGAGATQDLPNGLSIRLEAPEEWRVRQVSLQEGLHELQARHRIHEVESQREYLRKIYELHFPRKPAFNITYDCSVFTIAQIAQNVAGMMQLRGMIGSRLSSIG